MNNNKKLTIVALVVAIICLSVGFAAFSSTLNINSTASVNPVNNFKVVFADTVTGNGTVFTSYTTNNVNGTSSNGAIGGSAVIDNSDKTSPNLSSVTANFTKPGQSVTYTLYVVDDSDYDAYITEINKVGTKVCTPGNGTTSDLVDDACSGISISAVLDSSTSLPQTITKKGYKPLVITLTYASDAQAVDGDFTITFEDIEIKAATLSGNKEMLDPLIEDEEEEEEEMISCLYGNIEGEELSIYLYNNAIYFEMEDIWYYSNLRQMSEEDAKYPLQSFKNSIQDYDSDKNLTIYEAVGSLCIYNYDNEYYYDGTGNIKKFESGSISQANVEAAVEFVVG